jgi:hypothetical protein
VKRTVPVGGPGVRAAPPGTPGQPARQTEVRTGGPGFHKTPLAVGKGGVPVVTHAEDELAQRPACSRMSDEPARHEGPRGLRHG